MKQKNSELKRIERILYETIKNYREFNLLRFSNFVSPRAKKDISATRTSIALQIPLYGIPSFFFLSFTKHLVTKSLFQFVFIKYKYAIAVIIILTIDKNVLDEILHLQIILWPHKNDENIVTTVNTRRERVYFFQERRTRKKLK